MNRARDHTSAFPVAFCFLMVMGWVACAQPDPDPAHSPTLAPPPDTGVLTLGELLDSADSLVGKTVRVLGACAGWSGPAGGPPPLSRSDWQLQDDRVGIWVSGPLPQGCDPVNPPAEEIFEILASVAVDTVSAPGVGQGRVRYFLIRR